MSPQHYCWENRCTGILHGSVSRKDESLNQKSGFPCIPCIWLVFGEIACSFYTVSVHRWIFFPTAEQLWWNENANWMQQISGQQWLLAVLSLQLTPQLAWCGPTQRVQPHDCPRLLVFRASTTNSQFISLLSFPSHRSPSMFDNFLLITHYPQPCSTLGLLFSSCLVLDLVWTLFGVGDMNLSQYFRRAR